MSGQKRLTGLLYELRGLFSAVSSKRRRQLLLLIMIMLFGAAAELFTIGALFPLLSAIADPENSPVMRFARPLLSELGLMASQEIFFALAAFFAFAALVSAALRVVLLWATYQFVYGISADLGVKLYADTLAQSYGYHIQQNTSQIIASVGKVDIVTNGVLMPLLNAMVSAVIATFIVAGLVLIDATVAIVSGIGFVTIYLCITLVTRGRLTRNGRAIAGAQDSRIKAMQEGLGGIRDVLLDRSQPVFVGVYSGAEESFRRARTVNGVLANSPRFIVEAAGMVLIACIAVSLTSGPSGLARAIPILGALALGAQRLLPLVQQVYLGWAAATGNQQILTDVVALLQRPTQLGLDSGRRLSFEKSISLRGVSFEYSGGRAPALVSVDLEIQKGARVGVAGRTGSGKSTLMDILIGLLEPTQGEITVDGIPLTSANRSAWQRNVAHVPQAIFLADASVAENIAFGVPAGEMDRARVRRAAEQAELAEVVAALPQGYDTRVGERGIQLSGGQRQRIGIARALYKRADVLVFDEATSALDNETEAAVMSAIERLDRNLTIILIAHRLSTLNLCDMVVRLERGTVVTPDTAGPQAGGSGVL